MKLNFKIPIYDHSVSFFTSKDELLKSKGVETEHDFVCFFLSENNNLAILVSDLWGSYTEVNFMRCLSHECNHAAMIILDSVGVTFDGDNQESLCYLQDFIFSKILSALWKEVRKEKAIIEVNNEN
tara:strand:+ start:292 stop:669 length:378 start_codon:yes stop_codon:yes gene_type:complete